MNFYCVSSKPSRSTCTVGSDIQFFTQSSQNKKFNQQISTTQPKILITSFCGQLREANQLTCNFKRYSQKLQKSVRQRRLFGNEEAANSTKVSNDYGSSNGVWLVQGQVRVHFEDLKNTSPPVYIVRQQTDQHMLRDTRELRMSIQISHHSQLLK